METKATSSFWWVKTPSKEIHSNNNTLTVPKLDLEISSSLAEFLEKEQNILNSNSNRDDNTDVDVGSIIEEINRVAAQSPLGPYDLSHEERSIDEIMKEAERVYMESSRSFEQLSQRSKTSQNLTDILSSKNSTPTPKSISPLPNDDDVNDDESQSETYSEDFSEESKMQSVPQSPVPEFGTKISSVSKLVSPISSKVNTPITSPIPRKISPDPSPSIPQISNTPPKITPIATDVTPQITLKSKFEQQRQKSTDSDKIETSPRSEPVVVNNSTIYKEEIQINKDLVRTLELDNKQLREDIRGIMAELQQTSMLLDQTKAALAAKSLCSPEINLELERTLEELKDSKEINTALQLQLDTINKTHCLLKNSHEDLLHSNKNLERRVHELDFSLDKYKGELLNIQQQNDKLIENESNLNKLLEIEKLQGKSLKLQNEKDAKCIQDLNRQIKEMERIIARKHPDSVSALIVAAKNNASDTNLTARKVLEDRIKMLEEELSNRDAKSSHVFLDIQEKFTQMKLKYENHIEDLELHVNDLKQQLKRRADTFDIYTQTIMTDAEKNIPQKDTVTVGSQTDMKVLKRLEMKEDSHLMATIRGLQTDLSNKEKVVLKLQREVDELKKTNKKLQKDREGSLRSLNDRREFRSYPEKLALQVKSPDEEDIKFLKSDREKMKQQLCRMEEDYQMLKNKRLHDLHALQEAHEREISNYLQNVSPLREQLEFLQVQLSTTQNQLASTKEELLMMTMERNHLSEQLKVLKTNANVNLPTEVQVLQKKVVYLEKRYEERESRLRSIVHGLVQKTANQQCEQCADRQEQLIGYKMELDQLLETVKALKS